jgi:conjugative transfer region protein TrbK
MRRLDARAWVRFATVVILAAVIVASLIAVSHSPRSAAPAAAASGGDTVTVELDRCRALGTDAGKDPACQAAWRGLREHFFGQDGKEHLP